jgi:hypothetical protein
VHILSDGHCWHKARASEKKAQKASHYYPPNHGMLQSVAQGMLRLLAQYIGESTRIGQHKVIRNSANRGWLWAKSLDVIRIFSYGHARFGHLFW